MNGTKKMFLMMFVVVLILLVIGGIVQAQNGKQNFFSQYFHISQSNSNVNQSGLTNLKPMTLGKNTVMVQVADTESVREKGLSGVSNLPADQGMLFIFDSKQVIPSFWMKSMLIPLDFIWISGGKVTQITANVKNPLPGTPDSALTIYKPNSPIDWVLEVNASFAAKNNIKVGDGVAL